MRSYSPRTLKPLWGRAAGRCGVPTCRIELFAEATDYDPIVVIGDIAHIEAASDRGPRANPKRSKGARDEYDNLILLCKNCHARLDGQKRSNSVESIKRLRQDHEAWVRANLPERGRSRLGWQAVFLQGFRPIDQEAAITTISPDHAMARQIISGERDVEESWEQVYARIGTQVTRLFQAGDTADCRVAVFPLAPVSSCITLGYLLTNRPRVRLFQYHRDEQNWRWHSDSPGTDHVSVEGLTRSSIAKKGDVAICFGISASVTAHQIRELKRHFIGRITVTVSSPSTAWLRSERQLSDLARVGRDTFERCAQLFPRASRWHLFCAVPAPVAVSLGQQLNPTMCPAVQLYEFNRARRLNYTASVVLNTGGAHGAR